MHAQVECGFIYEVMPSLTNMRELAPPKSVIPTVLLIQSIDVKYLKECIIVEQIDNRVWYIVSSLGCGSGRAGTVSVRVVE